MVGILHPQISALTQRQIAQENVWQVRLVRTPDSRDVTRTSRSVDGYRVLARLANCVLRLARPLFSVQTATVLSVSFRTVSALAAADGDALQVLPPPSLIALAGAAGATSSLCQLWLSRGMLPAAGFTCIPLGANGLEVRLQGGTAFPEEVEVQVDFEIYAGNASLIAGAPDNRWSITTVDRNAVVKDQTQDIPGFTVYASLENAALVPQDVTAMSYANHAEFRFQVSVGVSAGASLVIGSPVGFALYPLTFRPSGLPGADTPEQPKARQGDSLSEAIVSMQLPLAASQMYSFHITVGNPAVSPPDNLWVIEIRDAGGETVNIDSQIPGFLVQSAFNTSIIESQLDEPLAENYIHITVAVSERLVADSILERSTCVPTVEEPVCPPRRGLATFIVVVAPEGFQFQATCGYWVLSRVGSRYYGLPPGSLCRADQDQENIARVQVSLSLEPLRIYEFTLQVRNALSVPLDNVWELRAVQDGVVRERNARVEGFSLRQLRTLRLTPSTTLAGVVDNTVTVQMRSERPLSRGSEILVVAPVGFVFDPDSAASSFPNPVTVELVEASTVRFRMSELDFVAPNTFFFVSLKVRNPPQTPTPNFWYYYIQSQFNEHIDLLKYYNGFAIAHTMYYCQVYPNRLPWDYGSWNELSLLFVTRYPIFTEEAAQLVPGKAAGEQGSWSLTLVAPSGFRFPQLNRYTDRCSGFRRWGGKESYEQLPETQANPIRCSVLTSRSVLITVPTSLINQTRYSFRINATVAATRSEISFQEQWRLTVLESGQIVHLGSSPSPLLAQYYEAEWFWVGDQASGDTAAA